MQLSVEDRQANTLAVFAADGRRCMSTYLIDDPLQDACLKRHIVETVSKTVKDEPSILGNVAVDNPIGDARRFLCALAELVIYKVRKQARMTGSDQGFQVTVEAEAQ